MSPGTAEDLPRRTPPKRPASPAAPDQEGWPEPTTFGWPGAGPVIPGPRHAAADDSGPDSSFGGPIQPTFRLPPAGATTPPGEEVPPPRPAGDDRPSPYATDEGDWVKPAARDTAAATGGPQGDQPRTEQPPAEQPPAEQPGPQRAPQAAESGAPQTGPGPAPAAQGDQVTAGASPDGGPAGPVPATAPAAAHQDGPDGSPPAVPTQSGTPQATATQARPPDHADAAPDPGAEEGADSPHASPWAGPPRPTQD
jgi:hypothetical protein